MIETKQKQLENRLENFAINVTKLLRTLPKTSENRIYSHQVIRSSSSIGANYTEATCAHTKKDFIHDVNKARKEAKETLYWLNLISRINLQFKLRMGNLIDESEQIVKIFQSSVSTAKNSLKK
jgi:four helix bundle protein